MPAPQGLVNSLNRIREISSTIYHQYIPIIDDTTDISAIGQPVLTVPQVANEFMSQLVNRIVYTQFEVKYFQNPLQVLEGDQIPLGYAGQEIYVNPATGRKFNVDDFAGLLQKYEADVKVQYFEVNLDLQYPVTVSRHKLKQAFVSWDALNEFIDSLSNSLYNGAYIDEYRFTKNLVSSAYNSNMAQIVKISAPNTEALAKEFITQARTYYLNFQTPSTEYNAWSLAGGKGRPITTWTNPNDIVFLIRNDIRAYLDVNVLASAFNIDKSTLLGNILPVDNFDVYSTETGNKIFDGSGIIGFIGDKKWFRIKRQDMYLDEFYNANNRTWQYYLNLTKMYQYSLFSNGIIFSTSLPTVTITNLDYNDTDSINLVVGESEGLDINVTPPSANSPAITYESSDATVASIQTDDDNDRHVTVTGVKAGNATITAKAGNIETTISVKVS